MTLQVGRAEGASAGLGKWHLRSPEDVCAALDVDRAVGMSTQRAAQTLADDGPNEMPEESPRSGLRRFTDEYRSYMQIILVAAAIVSLATMEWSPPSCSWC